MPQAPGEQTPGAESGILHSRPQSIEPPKGGPSGLQDLGLGRGRDGKVLVRSAADRTRPAPLILALHGAGGVAAQVIDLFAKHAEAHGIIVLAPESRTSSWDVIRGGYGPDVEFIDRALQMVFQQHAVDPERLAVAGFSDGASYALSLGLTNGTLFSDILAFSPGFMAPTQQDDAPRIFISHGEQDEVLPIGACSRRIVPLLQRAGYDVDYREFGGGHVVPDEMVGHAVTRFLG
ncbi:alpha/beta hydrolase [Microvirga sp. GCM10011540]|uniref:alpha/beta hydrolase n=1 Tax=Microvirga sp. GCM10011540 TaxID=3317338 RepID=UPI00361DA1F0